MTENKVVYGLKNAHYAKITYGETGVPTFGTPMAIKGAVELSIEPQSNAIEFGADNDSAYFYEEENIGYSGTLTIATVPQAFKVDILGEEYDETDGTLTEISNAKFSPFALLFEFDGDATATRHVLYRCNGSRFKIGSKTGKEITGSELAINAKPIEIGEKMLVKSNAVSDDSAKYADWFKTVYVKGNTPAEA